jgi:hypothetical protein
MGEEKKRKGLGGEKTTALWWAESGSGAGSFTRLGGETDGRSKQTTSRMVCLCLRGADVGSFGSKFRVGAYVIMENHKTAEDSLNGVLDDGVLGRG